MKLKLANRVHTAVLGAALAVVGVGLTGTSAEAATCSGVKIATGGLNVRTAASTSGSIIGVAHQGEIYIHTGATSGGWKQIWFNSRTGWVSAANYTTAVSVSCGTVTATALNVRTGPSTGYRSVGTVPQNSKWALIGSSGDWRKIWFDSEQRWVHGGYLNTAAPAPEIQLTAFNINNNAATTTSRYVTLRSAYTHSTATHYRASENSNFSGATWQPFKAEIPFTLSDGAGTKVVYFQVKNAQGRLSNIRSDDIRYAPPANDPNPSAAWRIERKAFYDSIRASFGSLNQSQVDGINYLLANMEKDTRPAINNKTVWMRQIAYIFATVKHEVANTYQPITEFSDKFCPRYDGGCRYKGRGYVQLTHRYNYQKMSPIVGVDLVTYPERALEPNIAYTVMSYGMFYGSFTGRKLGDYIKAGVTDYVNARRVVNGTDRAQLIAGYARSFQTALERSTYAK